MNLIMDGEAIAHITKGKMQYREDCTIEEDCSLHLVDACLTQMLSFGLPMVQSGKASQYRVVVDEERRMRLD